MDPDLSCAVRAKSLAETRIYILHLVKSCVSMEITHILGQTLQRVGSIIRPMRWPRNNPAKNSKARERWLPTPLAEVGTRIVSGSGLKCCRRQYRTVLSRQTVHYRQGLLIALFSLNRTEELRAGFGISVSDSCRLHLCHEKTG